MELNDSMVMAQRLLTSIPGDAANTFTVDQISALELALQKQYGFKKHPVDMRMRFKFGSNRYYVVFLAGPEKRPKRRPYEMSDLSNALTYLVVAGLVALQVIFIYNIT